MIDEKKLIEKIERLENIVCGYSHGVSHVCANLLCELKDFIKEQPFLTPCYLGSPCEYQNKNVILPKEWIPFTFDEDDMLNCPLPDAEEEILISDGISVWVDTLMTNVEDDNIVYYLDSSNRNLKGLAWMPLPEPHVKKASGND